MWIKMPCTTEVNLDGSAGTFFLGSVSSLYHQLEPYAGKVQTVYIDPPYLTGDNFEYKLPIGQAGFTKGKPYASLPAYSDKFESRESYLEFLKSLCSTAYKLLCTDGTLFLHLDTRMTAYAKVMLDSLMGEKCFVNEIVWAYETGGRSTHHFSRKHDTILMYRKSPHAYFNIEKVGILRKDKCNNHMKKHIDSNGRSYSTIRTNGKTYTYYDDSLVYPSDVWTDISHLQQRDPQRTGYGTQKPLKLLERIILSSTKPGDCVADLCFGSGTTLLCAAQHERVFLGADASPAALSAARKRLLDHPFTLIAPVNISTSSLDASIADGLGYYEVTLNAFSLDVLPAIVPSDTVLNPLDLVDQWSAGILKDGIFHAKASATRQKGAPVLKDTLEVPMVSGQVAIMIADIRAHRHLFVWED